MITLYLIWYLTATIQWSGWNDDEIKELLYWQLSSPEIIETLLQGDYYLSF